MICENSFEEYILDKITVYAGDIIDGISVDGHLFGSKGGSPFDLNLAHDEFVTNISFGHHTHRQRRLFC